YRLPAVTAFCHTHYGGGLTAAGRWPEADAAWTEAVGWWGLGRGPAQRRGAAVRLADLRVRQGRIEEAEQLLAELTADAEAPLPLAAIHRARGETTRAADVLDRGLAQLPLDSAVAAPLLAMLVDVHLAAGHAADGASAAERLAAIAARHRGPFLMASAALAHGSIALADGLGDDARTCLRGGVGGFAGGAEPRPVCGGRLAVFAGAELPMELARTQLALAAALAKDRPEVALAEARA